MSKCEYGEHEVNPTDCKGCIYYVPLGGTMISKKGMCCNYNLKKGTCHVVNPKGCKDKTTKKRKHRNTWND